MINPCMLNAATHAMAIMGIAGEVATRRSKGNGSLQVNFLDELCVIDGGVIRENLKQANDEVL